MYMDTKFIISYLNDNQEFSPVKYFVHKHSVLPSEMSIDVNSKFNANLFYNRLVEKFSDFTRVEKSILCNNRKQYKSFILISEDKKDSIVFIFANRTFKYYATEIEPGLVCIINEIIGSCYETSN